MKLGVYQHYKGANYQVEKIVRHSETEEELVIYQCLYGDRSWWARPKSMFLESIQVGAQTRPRFVWVCDNEAELP